MDADFVENAIFRLYGRGELNLPYGCAPLIEGEVDAQRWQAITWNPPDGQKGITGPDPNASPKPSWEEIELEDRTERASPAWLNLRVNEACTEAIIAAYGARDLQNEFQRRLSGQTTDAQDAERVRLIARCHAVEAEIAEATTLDQREGILGRINDGTWSDEPE